MTVYTNFFGGAFFGGGFFGAGVEDAIPGGGGGSTRPRHKVEKQKNKPIRWSDYAHSEERAAALAKALAEAGVTLEAIDPDSDDEFTEEDGALIHALLLSRVIH